MLTTQGSDSMCTQHAICLAVFKCKGPIKQARFRPTHVGTFLVQTAIINLASKVCYFCQNKTKDSHPTLRHVDVNCQNKLQIYHSGIGPRKHVSNDSNTNNVRVYHLCKRGKGFRCPKLAM
jgi:hypothetical protein